MLPKSGVEDEMEEDMFASNSCVKSAWIAVEVTRDRAEKVLVVEAYIPVSSLEANFDPARYGKLVEDIRCVLDRNPDIDRASILSMHKDKACAGLFRQMSDRAQAGQGAMPSRALHA